MSNTMWWDVTRAAGLTAWVFLTLTVVWGTIASGKLISRSGARRWLLDLHPYLGSVGLGALVLHIVGAVADTTVHLKWSNTVVPFTSSWNRLGVTMGVLALWTIMVVEITSVARRRLGKQAWHRIHLSSYAAAWLMTLHAAFSGTDRSNPIVAFGGLALVALATFATLLRIRTARASQSPARHRGTALAIMAPCSVASNALRTTRR